MKAHKSKKSTPRHDNRKRDIKDGHRDYCFVEEDLTITHVQYIIKDYKCIETRNRSFKNETEYREKIALFNQELITL